MPRTETSSSPPIPAADLLQQLKALLDGGQAHASFDAAVSDFPSNLRGTVPEKVPYSAWQLVEHMRITQHDILQFSAPPTGGYHPLRWPEDYWPQSPEPPSPGAWDDALASIRRDRAAFDDLLTRSGTDLVKPFRWGDGQNLLREALLIADHTSYHTGELVLLRRLLGIWNPR